MTEAPRPVLGPDTFQAAFAAALQQAPQTFRDERLTALTGQPAFAVYRNTVRKACIDALQANYPVVAKLVGVPYFQAFAALYVAEQPPRDARLLDYGQGLPDFLAASQAAHGLAYLPGVARLDRSWTEAHVAADRDTATLDMLAALPPEALACLQLRPHPAARCHWFHDAPVFSIWQRNRASGNQEPGEIAWQAEGALITRPGDTVIWQSASAADHAFLQACNAGRPLAEAAAAAQACGADVDLSSVLARLFGAGALCLHAPARTSDPATTRDTP